MAESITIKKKDGTGAKFVHRGRAGGSYTIRLSFEGAFAIITDEWGKRTCYPAADIQDIVEEPSYR